MQPVENPPTPFMAVVLCSLLAPITCLTVGLCLIPSAAFRLEHGPGPLASGKHQQLCKGMAATDVIALLGPPHRIDENAPSVWVYYEDIFQSGSVTVSFDPEGRVISWWTD